MRDIVIKGKTVGREILIFSICFLIGFLINLGAIIAFDRPAIELLSQIGYVIVISLGLYILLWILRLIICFFKMIFGITKKNKTTYYDVKKRFY